MQGVQLTATIDDGGALAALKELEARLVDMKPAFDEIGQALQTSTHQRFEDAAGPDGRAWPDLSEATKAARGADAKPLLARRHLYDSINWRAGMREVAVGSNRKYARIQQLGGEAGRGLKTKIPARPYLGISRDD